MLIQTGHVQIHHVDASSPHSIRVDFDPPFEKKPHMQLGIIALDIRPDGELRINSNIEEVQPDYCVLRFNTWADSRIHWGRVSWLAIGDPAEGVDPSHVEATHEVVEHPDPGDPPDGG